MAFFEWSSDLETGVNSIDFQHQHLVNMINNLAEALAETPEFGQDLIVQVTMEQLVDYTQMHFKHEESLMEVAHYEHFHSHKQAHEELKKQVKEFNEQLRNQVSGLGPKILEFLKSWLTNHIMKIDLQYVPAMVKARIE